MKIRLTPVLTTVAFITVVTITVMDFLNDGVIDNGKFLIVSLCLFSGLISGRLLDGIVDKYLGNGSKNEKE